MFVSMRQFSSNILNFFFPGLGWPSHLSWVTWKETNLKMKLLTETERSGCADASPWRVLMFLKIFFFFNSLKCGIFTNMIWVQE